MAKVLTLEEQLAGARALRGRGAEVTDGEIGKSIGSKHSAVTAAGAEIAGEYKRAELEEMLVATFERFMKEGAKTDKGCVAKLAIVNALCKLDCREAEVYLRGVRCVQKEPSFGGAVDTAGELRGRCAIALAESGYPGALGEVTPLLMDEEGQARVGACRAVLAVGSEGAAAVLKLKLVVGDEEPLVLGECCTGLLGIAGDGAVDFVAKVLGEIGIENAEGVLSVLAESRSTAVLAVMRKMYEEATDEKRRRVALGAMAVLRVDGATEFLLELVEKQLHPRAREVVEALGARKQDERLRGRLEEALERRDDAFLLRHYHAVFNGGSR